MPNVFQIGLVFRRFNNEKFKKIEQMKTVTVIELVNTNTQESLGYAPVIEEKGQKPTMIADGDKPMTFKTKKDAKSFGLEWIKPKN